MKKLLIMTLALVLLLINGCNQEHNDVNYSGSIENHTDHNYDAPVIEYTCTFAEGVEIFGFESDVFDYIMDSYWSSDIVNALSEKRGNGSENIETIKSSNVDSLGDLIDIFGDDGVMEYFVDHYSIDDVFGYWGIETVNDLISENDEYSVAQGYLDGIYDEWSKYDELSEWYATQYAPYN